MNHADLKKTLEQGNAKNNRVRASTVVRQSELPAYDDERDIYEPLEEQGDSPVGTAIAYFTIILLIIVILDKVFNVF